MVSYSVFKNTVLFSIVLMAACGNLATPEAEGKKPDEIEHSMLANEIITGAENLDRNISILQGKRVGIVTNQTGILKYYPVIKKLPKDITCAEPAQTVGSVVDFLLNRDIDLKKIYAPEHGFRGTADAGELIKDGKDTKTGLPIISLYGNNKKPKPEQLAGIDILVFDLQDVGARFYTYISSLHYIMEACAENNIELVLLDRPNPNGGIVDGPVLEKENSSFVGMHPIPAMHGMTIGEYGKMINGEKWLKNGAQCQLTVIPCTNYERDMPYSLPQKPSPNLPNDQAINLYASLCLFEGTNVSMGRGTDKQFQIYGSPYLPAGGFSFTPGPNEGAKDPVYNGKKCYGEDLSKIPFVKRLELKWIIKAYSETADKSKFFNDFFIKLSGTKKLREQIEAGMSEEQIRASWQTGLTAFKKMRKPYLIYPE